MSTSNIDLKSPWEATELRCEDHRGMGWVHDFDNRDVCCYGANEFSTEHNRAIGRLIGTAPELLEALKRIFDSALSDGGALQIEQDDRDFARAAIAKAEGKQ